MLFKTITEDRTGEVGELVPVIKMGDLFLNAYPEAGEDHSKYPHCPIDLVWNQHSCLLQNLQTVNRSALYDEYWYLSGLNPAMVKHLREVVRIAKKFVDLNSGDVVLDIASNDGTLLRQYSSSSIRTVGYDPAKNLKEEAQKGVSHHYPFCFDSCHFLGYFDPAKIITACAVVYHVPNPLNFLRQVSECLADDGVFVCEFTWLPYMMRNNAYDSIGHEHITHLSLTSFEKMLKKVGLEIVHTTIGDINAGTILCVIKKTPCHDVDNDSNAFLRGLREYEWHLGMSRQETYTEWGKKGTDLKFQLHELLEELERKNKKVYVYGASTKGSILLQWVAQEQHTAMCLVIQKAVERDERKIGKEMIGLHIPVISEKQARKDNPDYMLVLPWHFRDNFVEREKDYLKNGGRFIFPLPELEVVTG